MVNKREIKMLDDTLDNIQSRAEIINNYIRKMRRGQSTNEVMLDLENIMDVGEDIVKYARTELFEIMRVRV